MQEKGAIGDNMNLGSTFRKLRQEKGISISSLSGENISKSQISRFERGETDISFQKLFYLLESISISMEEFLSLSHNNQCPNFNNFIQQLEEVFFSNNITYLNQLLNTEYHYYQETSYTYHLLNCIMIKNMLLKSTGKDESTKCEKLF
ncbi:helix-turn-helix domain-containing protein [Streptococcus didelphis]|nr:helix-turn-helix transcriptional regulator [Streptococcus didelphis]WMB29173.1 helix-turn-helix domain-containing protein [Streptococcus didelphis]